MGLGGGGGTTPKPPKFVPASIPDLENQAYQYDQQAYGNSDADYLSRFPGLVSERQQQLDDSYKQLTGPLDPQVQNSFVRQGAAQSFGAFGGGNSSAGIGKGTAAGNAVATSLANNVQKKQDYDRQNFEGLLANNPQRQFGLTGEDVLNLSIANTQGKNNYLQGQYGAQYGAYNAGNAAQGQATSAAISAAIAIGLAALAASDKRVKKDIKDTGAKTKEGIPIKTFKYKHDKKGKKHVGVIAQEAEKIRPDVVHTHPVSGIKSIDYAKLLFQNGDKQ